MKNFNKNAECCGFLGKKHSMECIMVKDLLPDLKMVT